MTLIPPEKIAPSVGAIDVQEDMLYGADLVNRILYKNKEQQLGRYKGKVVVLELSYNRKIFLCTALIQEAYKPAIFTYTGQNKILESL
jgi:hypothetical protein